VVHHKSKSKQRTTKHAEFKPLAEWKRERTLFQLIADISFFKHFAVARPFRRWRAAKRAAAFARVRAAVASRLFHAKPLFCAALQDVAAAAAGLSAVQFAATGPHTYHSLDEYCEVQVRLFDVLSIPSLLSVPCVCCGCTKLGS
jgi:dynein heavy chain, axonemal